MITIRKITDQEVEAFANLHLFCFEETYRAFYPKEVFEVRRQKIPDRILHIKEKMKQDSSYFYYGLFDDWSLVGICIFSIVDAVGVVDALYLLPAYQRKGYGTKLFCLIDQTFQEQGVVIFSSWVLEGLASTAFFEKLGGTYVTTEEISIHGKDYQEREYLWKVGEIHE